MLMLKIEVRVLSGFQISRLMANLWVLILCCMSLISTRVLANVVLMTKNATISFEDTEANFSPSVKASGECGTLFMADPLDACSPLKNITPTIGKGCLSPFALIVRGGCSFEDKVRRAQIAGFKAAIVYDDEVGDLVAMAGNLGGVVIPAVFISKASGQVLSKYAGATDVELWIIPSFENSAWSIMAISFISLLAMSAVLATCFFVRRHRIRRERPRASRTREFHGMSSQLVKAMPSLIFTAVLDDNCTSSTCAICIEDYTVGEKLRVLPCQHKFHAACVDAWLTSWRTFCPVCKRDARTSTGEPPASERTPLLSSAASSMLLSFRSSIASSPAMQIGSSRSNRFASISHVESYGSSYYQQSLQSYHQSPHLSASRSSLDLRNASSHRSIAPHLASSNSLGYPSFSPLNSRYMSPYIPSPGNALGYISSSSQQPHPLHLSESAASFSPYASAQSLPEC